MAVAAVAVVIFVVAWATGRTTVFGLLSTGIAAAGALAATAAARWGTERLGGALLFGGVWLAGLTVLLSSGTASPAGALFLVSVVLSAMVWGSRAIGVIAALSLTAGLLTLLLLPEGLSADARAAMVERRFFIELELLAAMCALALWWAVRTESLGAAAATHRRHEQELSALHRAVQASRSGVAITDREGRLRFVNRAALDMWGASQPEDVLGRPALDFWAEPFEAAAVAKKLEEGDYVVAELQGKRTDGTTFDVEISGTRVPATEGGVELRIGSMIDITGRKQVERTLEVARERMRAIVDNAHDIVIILDTQGRIVFENAAVERILGFAPGERLGKGILEYAHPDDLAGATQGLAAVMTEPDKLARVTLRFRHKDGSWRWLETQGRNLIAEPAIGGILGIGRDVTEQRQMQARLEATERLETVGRLAGGLAHDFNNLLTAILGNAELAERTANPGEIHRHLQGIVASAERARELTRKLLGFARLEHSRPVVVDLRRRMLDADELLRRLLGEDVRLRTDVGDDALPALIDPVQFEQVLLNLAVNARDAMPDGGAFTLTAERIVVDALSPAFMGSVRPGAAVRILASDSGHGMSADVLARIFEPFFTTKEHGRGTGLGLSTVYGSVVQAGGAIRVQSELRQGTTFEILLPLVDARECTEPQTQTPTISALSGLIVVAEDDAAVRHLMQEVLTGAGCNVLTARNGAQGMTLVTRHCHEIAVLVTDVVMPDVRGTELAAHFRRLRPDGRVIFVTGYSADTSLSQQAAAIGAPILQKPFRVDQFLAEVDKAVRASR